METREIFDATPLSVGQFLSETGQGLYIPPYQRNYSWELAKVKRLVDDVAHGLDQMREMEDSICFLGTVIALRDMNYVTVEPVFRSMVPPKVMTIIDGQQRVTTLVILTSLLHEEIRLRAARLSSGGDPAETWLLNQSHDVVGRLGMTFEEDMRYGDGDFRYYPRAIRAYYDVWSRNDGEAAYLSPIGHYLHRYAAHTRGPNSAKPYRHEPLDVEASDEPNAEAHQHLAKMRAQIRRLLSRLATAEPSEDSDDSVLPGGEELASSEQLQLGLFNSPLQPDVRASIGQGDFQPLCRLIVLANYLLLRVTVAVVTAKREEYGFDMFEALNTTGEPLTAIETFKPRVARAEGLGSWKQSPSKASFDRVDAHLERGSGSTDKRQSATSSLLIPFALAQSGRRLGKRLNEQRQYLRTAYDEQPDLAAKRDFVAMLAQVVSFMDGPWSAPTEVSGLDSGTLVAEAALSLAALRAGGHDVVVGPLGRYYGAYRLTAGDDGQRAERARQFLLAARTCAGFYGLWRGAHGGTSGIDDVWRKAMQGEPGTVRLARGSGPLEHVPDVAELQTYLHGRLDRAGALTRDQWIRRAAITPLGAYASLARLLLLAASQDSAPDPQAPGLTVRGRPGLLAMLDLGRWNDETTLTVEHVAPQQPGQGEPWDRALYDTPDLIDSLGNLTLLPRSANASVSNRDWPTKRLLYRALSATTVDEAEALLAQAQAAGVAISASSGDVVSQAQHLPLVAATAARDGAWDAEFVRARSARLAGLAWDVLAEWTGLATTRPDRRPSGL